MKIVTNIIFFLANMCIFENVLIILYLQTHLGLRKSKVCFYTLNKVSYTSNYENNPKATHVHPILRAEFGRHHLSKNI